MPLPRREQRYTYADYCTWNDGERWELIDGAPYLMSPAPGRRHQEISGELFAQLHNFLEGKPCKVYIAPFDVRLDAGGEDDTVCQPDIIVVCDTSKLDEKGCKGAPDLAVEVLSPSSTRMDGVVKLEKYREAGVREYWIVSPDARGVQAFLLDGGRYYVAVYTD
ncbi:MAG: Uma2 family endonuclease, partial [Acidobacteriota bacterium]|nr:Uma2 family endonuclease [Acidobacteriota bacterium]